MENFITTRGVIIYSTTEPIGRFRLSLPFRVLSVLMMRFCPVLFNHPD